MGESGVGKWKEFCESGLQMGRVKEEHRSWIDSFGFG